MTSRMEESFKKRVARGDKYPLLWAMHETFKWEFWLGGIFQFFAQLFQVFAPFTLRYLIQFATDAYIAQTTGSPAPAIGKGIGLVLGITGMQICQSLGVNHFIYRGMMIGGQARAVLISMIFDKAMKISGRAKAGGRALDDDPEGSEVAGEEKVGNEDKEGKKSARKDSSDQARGVSGDGTGWGNGRVVNLMSVDTYRLDQASAMFHLIWTAPIACILTLVLLVINLHESALAGFALLIIGIPALTMAIKSLFVRRRAINKITDQRVSLTQEILQAVRFVKYFGWEMAFLDRLSNIRNREIHAIQILLAIRNAINAVSMSLPIFASMLAFITYSLTDNALNPANVFSSLALFNSLRMPLNLLPLVIGQVVDAWSSLKRVQEYLLCEEQLDEAVWDLDAKGAIKLTDANFTWERTVTQDANDLEDPKGKPRTKAELKADNKSKMNTAGEEKPGLSGVSSGETTPDNASESTREPFKLHDMNFTLGRNELVAVIGGVGSGKSSLLAALAGDMRKTSGEIVFGADRAFCPQYAWIQNATVKENILFGKKMDRHWYDTVIDACALRPDLDMLPNNDQTEIGERGITVSGGQKQRLNIARAIYFDADIVLMDDPLSAVDAHVGRHIFDNAICGLLKDKCRVLATHQLWVLNRCDRIIWLEDGRIQAIDTYDNLMANDAGFQHLMKTTAVEEEEEEKDHANEEGGEEGKHVVEKKKKNTKGPGLMQAEERQVKSVPWSVYASYIKASGSMWSIVLVVTLLILSQGGKLSSFYILSKYLLRQQPILRPRYGCLGGRVTSGGIQLELISVATLL